MHWIMRPAAGEYLWDTRHFFHWSVYRHHTYPSPDKAQCNEQRMINTWLADWMSEWTEWDEYYCFLFLMNRISILFKSQNKDMEGFTFRTKSLFKLIIFLSFGNTFWIYCREKSWIQLDTTFYHSPLPLCSLSKKIMIFLNMAQQAYPKNGKMSLWKIPGSHKNFTK